MEKTIVDAMFDHDMFFLPFVSRSKRAFSEEIYALKNVVGMNHEGASLVFPLMVTSEISGAELDYITEWMMCDRKRD